MIFPGIITEGLSNYFIETYTIKYSKDHKTWKIYKEATSKEKKVPSYKIPILHSVPWKHTIPVVHSLFFNQSVLLDFFLLCVQVFEASSDGHTIALNSLFPPITARYLQIWPQRWHGRVSVQMQVLGCPLSGFRPRSNAGGEAPSLYSHLAFALCFFFMKLFTNYLSEFLLYEYSTKVIRPRNFKTDFFQSW